MNKGHIQAERAEAIHKAMNTGTQENVENVNRERNSGPLAVLRATVTANLSKPGAKWTPETGWTNDPVK